MKPLLASALLLAAQAAAPRPTPPPTPEPDAIAETLFLIGDAGKPAKGGEPVLIALRAQLERAGGRATVVFLGDNLYPEGLPAPNHPERAEMERRLDDQVDAVKDVAARVIFIPGEYRGMREALAGAVKGRAPLAWAGGHEHVLEVIESPNWGRVLVSGAGIYGHETYNRGVPGSLYRSARAGYMRIDVLRDGRRRLGGIEVAADGGYREAYAQILE